MDYVQIATTGIGLDFGNLTTVTSAIVSGGTSSTQRGIFSGGRSPGANHYTM